MRRRSTGRARHARRALLAVVVLCAVLLGPATALAVSARGNHSVTVTPDTTLSLATYTLADYRTGNGDTVLGYTLTFPVDTDASGATSPGAGDTVSVAADDRTVTVTLGTPIPQRTTFTIELGNVRNPSTAGDYAITQVIFHRPNGDQTVTLTTQQGTYTITAGPYLSMTITTPDDGQTVDFGSIDPDVTTAEKTVGIAVLSSAPYTITRGVTGDDAALGLQIAGVPSGVAQVAAPLLPAVFVDTLTLTPPWTTDPDVPLTATLSYTVVQQP